MRKPLKVLAVGGLAVAMVAIGGLGLLQTIHEDPPPPPVPGVAATLQASPVIGPASLSQIIEQLQARLRSVPDDWRSSANLGLAYVQQARVSADPSFYPKAQDALEASLQIHPGGNFEAMTGMAALAAARHDFSGSLDWGERAQAVNPQNANISAVIGDALVELGRYEEGFDAFQQAVDLRPDLTTYARASYAWELQGNLDAATQIMDLASKAAGSPSDSAWTSYQLGELAWIEGDLERAETMYGRASQLDRSFVPSQAGLAKVAAARGRTDQAIALYQDVVARYPVPEYVVALGDLLASAGREAEAGEQYALVDVEAALFRANGVNVDLEIALFDADHGRPEAALAAAQAEWGRRHSIQVADALAWALHASGRDAEALDLADQALRLGTKNPLFLFHRGVIQHALGRDGEARRDLASALDLNPHFSLLWAGEAESLLAGMGGAP